MITTSSGNFHLPISSPLYSTIIQAATNLVSPNWISIYTNTPPFIFTDTNAPKYSSRFYRAVLGP
jgi:hypothetical protein